jgi:hypothetical protein
MERKSVGGERIVIILLSLVRSRDPRRFQLGGIQSPKPIEIQLPANGVQTNKGNNNLKMKLLYDIGLMCIFVNGVYPSRMSITWLLPNQVFSLLFGVGDQVVQIVQLLGKHKKGAKSDRCLARSMLPADSR